jgi:hypothetical protein
MSQTADQPITDTVAQTIPLFYNFWLRECD